MIKKKKKRLDDELRIISEQRKEEEFLRDGTWKNRLEQRMQEEAEE